MSLICMLSCFCPFQRRSGLDSKLDDHPPVGFLYCTFEQRFGLDDSLSEGPSCAL